LIRWVRVARVLLLALVLNGCAKFPTNGATQFTKITFNVTMGGPISPNYLYYIVMYASTDLNPVPSTVTPIPTIAAGAPNGVFTGDATTYVLMTPSNTARPCTVYQVGAPTNPGTLPDTISGQTNDQITLDSSGNYPSTWTCTLYTSDLAPSNNVLAQQFKSLTFQVISMNKTTLGTSSGIPSGRIMDAIGTGTSFEALTIPLNTSNTKSNATFGLIEPSNDTVGGYDPALDITDFNVTVSTP
jgi:hypothetical protein